ncbi:MAG: hypothetical protein ACO3IN_11105, partial [Steroidobacteraceae bacterium]
MAIEPNLPPEDEEPPRRPADRPVARPRARRRTEVAEYAPRDLGLALPPEQPEEEEDELSLREIWRVLTKHRWLV